MTKITIIGAGYVGLTTAAILATSGFETYILDTDKKRLRVIENGESFFYEEGLTALIQHSVDHKKLIPTASYKEAVPSSDIIISCVGTPDNVDGSSNLDYVMSAAKEAYGYMKPHSIYVQKSTVPVGTGQKIISQCHSSNKNTSYVSNPEFLKEGTALLDSLFFERIVIGSSDMSPLKKVRAIYEHVQKNRSKIIAISKITTKNNFYGEYIETGLNSAELIKVTANAFLALKISFANSIAMLSDKTGADVKEVMNAVGADSRIGRHFLNAGRGYGGGCFPKDVSGLIKTGLENEVALEIMEAATKVNNSMPSYIITKFQRIGRVPKNKTVAVLGLSFKSGTSDARRSPGVNIANLLATDGYTVKAFDPKANHDAKEILHQSIELKDSIADTLKDSAAVFITTDWNDFLEFPLKSYYCLLEGNIFFDCVNSFDPIHVNEAKMKYIGVGRGTALE